MKNQNQGISLISLIITIIVIIILAAIVIFSGMGTPEKAQLSGVISDIDSVQTAVDQAYYGFYTEKSVAGEVWTKSQFYEAVATGETNRDNLTGTGIVPISEVGMVKMNLPQYEGRSWGVAVEDIDENTKTGSVALIPGFETDGKIYSTLLDVQNDGRNAENKLTMNTELFDNSAAKLLKVGDYINYIPDNKTYTPDASILGVTNSSLSTESAIWRVWYVNKATGEVIISPETSVNEFKVNVMSSVDKSPEIDKLCRELYSNSALNLNAHFMTVEDVNKAFGYDFKPGEIVRIAYFLRSEGIENRSKIMYKGKEYIVDSICDEFILFNDYNKNSEYEGGEETVDSNGKSIRKLVAGKPIYANLSGGKKYYLCDYNPVIANYIAEKESRNYLQEWFSECKAYGTLKSFSDNEKYSTIASRRVAYLDLESKTFYINYDMVTTERVYDEYVDFSENLVFWFTFRPQITLTSSNLIDTTDATKDGNTQATAWEFKK